MKISTNLDLTESEKDIIIKAYKAIKTDYGSGHYLSVRKSKNGNVLASYHDDGNCWGGEGTHHGEINLGKII